MCSSDLRLLNLQKELAEIKDNFNVKKAEWASEKDHVDKLAGIREQIDSVNTQIQIAQRESDFEKAAQLQYGTLPELQKELEAEEEKAKSIDQSLVHEKVTEEEIAQIISRWSGIPVAKLTESERSKTLHLPEELHKRVVGQEIAVEKVSEAIMRSKAGIKDYEIGRASCRERV